MISRVMIINKKSFLKIKQIKLIDYNVDKPIEVLLRTWYEMTLTIKKNINIYFV